jgi:ankyrin repeat protein
MPDDLFVPPEVTPLLEGATPLALARIERGLTAALGETYLIRTTRGIVVATRDSRMKPLRRLALDPGRPVTADETHVSLTTDDGRTHTLPLPLFGGDEVRALVAADAPATRRTERVAERVADTVGHGAVRNPRRASPLPEVGDRSEAPPKPPTAPVPGFGAVPVAFLAFFVTLALTVTPVLLADTHPSGKAVAVLGDIGISLFVARAVHRAARRDAARTLLASAPDAPDPNRADEDEDDEGAVEDATDNALHRRAFAGDLDAVRALLDAGVSLDSRDDDGETALHAAATGEADVVQLLLERGADAGARDANGVTPIHRSADMGDVECIDLLVAAGADVNARDAEGRTPLHHAARSDAGLIRALIGHGALLEATDASGSTPLHVAATYGEDEEVRALLNAGANRHAVDAEGQTPADLATSAACRAALVE